MPGPISTTLGLLRLWGIQGSISTAWRLPEAREQCPSQDGTDQLHQEKAAKELGPTHGCHSAQVSRTSTPSSRATVVAGLSTASDASARGCTRWPGGCSLHPVPVPTVTSTLAPMCCSPAPRGHCCATLTERSTAQPSSSWQCPELLAAEFLGRILGANEGKTAVAGHSPAQRPSLAIFSAQVD